LSPLERETNKTGRDFLQGEKEKDLYWERKGKGRENLRGKKVACQRKERERKGIRYSRLEEGRNRKKKRIPRKKGLCLWPEGEGTGRGVAILKQREELLTGKREEKVSSENEEMVGIREGGKNVDKKKKNIEGKVGKRAVREKSWLYFENGEKQGQVEGGRGDQ